ncbi:MAG: class I SAM-dependent methyltransferase [Alphaproteobacteria bacterium]|nr:class I SAM-dependent methyltransferase [Alphaproteobacteria bacterium]
MKAALKKILPINALNTARALRDRTQIASIPERSFDLKNLRAESELDLQIILQDERIAEKYGIAREEISAIFGDHDEAGGINPGDRRALFSLISAQRPVSILEIGTHIGASTLYIAKASQACETQGHITTVDILDVNAPGGEWESLGTKKSPRENLMALGCADIVNFVQASAQDFMAETSETFDFIFLDGDHSAAGVYNELALALKILSPGGIILLHDYYPSARPLFPDGSTIFGPYEALCRAQKECPHLHVKPLGTLPWPTKQGTNVTSLALVLAGG